jgi:septal ring factor EnvC (AmiA/AmiB activator)
MSWLAGNVDRDMRRYKHSKSMERAERTKSYTDVCKYSVSAFQVCCGGISVLDSVLWHWLFGIEQLGGYMAKIDIDQLQEENKALKDYNEAVKKLNHALIDEKHALSKLVDSLKEQVAALTDKNDLLSAENYELHHKIDSLSTSEHDNHYEERIADLLAAHERDIIKIGRLQIAVEELANSLSQANMDLED